MSLKLSSNLESIFAGLKIDVFFSDLKLGLFGQQKWSLTLTSSWREKRRTSSMEKANWIWNQRHSFFFFFFIELDWCPFIVDFEYCIKKNKLLICLVFFSIFSLYKFTINICSALQIHQIFFLLCYWTRNRKMKTGILWILRHCWHLTSWKLFSFVALSCEFNSENIFRNLQIYIPFWSQLGLFWLKNEV